MANEKRLIDMEDALRRMERAEHIMHSINGIKAVDVGALRQFFGMLKPVDAVEVDVVAEMLDYFLGDCPCNYGPADEWLGEVCELQDECPHPENKLGCWKQFIKHWGERREGE